MPNGIKHILLVDISLEISVPVSGEWKELFSGQLTKGTHHLRIGGREDRACIDKLCITASPTPPITIGGSAIVLTK